MVNYRGFEGQVAWITGGGSGIGQAACVKLAKEKVKVMISGRRLEKLEETKKLIEDEGGYAECYVCDVTSQQSVADTVKNIVAKHGTIDIFVAAAGELGVGAYAFAVEDEAWDSTINTLLTGTFTCIKNVLPSMVQNNYGRIIVIGSAACIKGMACNSAYAAAKGGLTQLTKTIAKEFGKKGITCNIINPGIIETPMAEGLIQAYGRKTFENDMIVGELGQVEHVAHCIKYLADPLAAHVTGAEHDVTGGMFLSSNIENWLQGAMTGQFELIK